MKSTKQVIISVGCLRCWFLRMVLLPWPWQSSATPAESLLSVSLAIPLHRRRDSEPEEGMERVFSDNSRPDQNCDLQNQFCSTFSSAKRYLPPGWCALLCKIKNQDICGDPNNIDERSLGAGDALCNNFISSSVDAVSKSSAIVVIHQDVKLGPFHGQVAWNQHLRPILPRSRPNLWRRTTEFLAERNQL